MWYTIHYFQYLIVVHPPQVVIPKANTREQWCACYATVDLKKSPPLYLFIHPRLVCELTTSSTWHSIDTLSSIHEVGVPISVESLRVGLNLAKSESRSRTSVNSNASRVVGNASNERSRLASNGDLVVLASNWLWVRECDTWWSRKSFSALVDVSSCACWRLVFATGVVETNVVADCVELGVDAEVEEADCAWETTCCGVVGVDDLVWGGLHAVGGGEWDWESLCALVVAL